MTKLENEKVEELLSSYSANIKNVFSTIKYILKIKSTSTNGKTTTNINKDNTSLFLSIVWILIRYLVIAIELLTLRKKLFCNIFCKWADPLTYDTLARLVDNQSNYWLDDKFCKIKILENFLFEILEEPEFAQKLCKSANIKEEEFQKIKYNTHQVFDDYSSDLLNEDYIQTKALQAKKRPKAKKYSAEENPQLYEKSFNDTSLLNETEE